MHALPYQGTRTHDSRGTIKQKERAGILYRVYGQTNYGCKFVRIKERKPKSERNKKNEIGTRRRSDVETNSERSRNEAPERSRNEAETKSERIQYETTERTNEANSERIRNEVGMPLHPSIHPCIHQSTLPSVHPSIHQSLQVPPGHRG